MRLDAADKRNENMRAGILRQNLVRDLYPPNAVPSHWRPVTSWKGRVEISCPDAATPVLAHVDAIRRDARGAEGREQHECTRGEAVKCEEKAMQVETHGTERE